LHNLKFSKEQIKQFFAQKKVNEDSEPNMLTVEYLKYVSSKDIYIFPLVDFIDLVTIDQITDIYPGVFKRNTRTTFNVRNHVIMMN